MIIKYLCLLREVKSSKNETIVLHRKDLYGNIQDITKTTIRPLARRRGLKRFSVLIYEEISGMLKYNKINMEVRNNILKS
ncbi:Histone H4 [Armadillidium nasatum]|uniref:Histone H4 n=1 Tax=Armadillidium nasatum TaxID=96803 RepID=A0A5N5SJY2_9CRUS|nr:Histone H4 [Armadillidium nasatum]